MVEDRPTAQIALTVPLLSDWTPLLGISPNTSVLLRATPKTSGYCWRFSERWTIAALTATQSAAYSAKWRMAHPLHSC